MKTAQRHGRALAVLLALALLLAPWATAQAGAGKAEPAEKAGAAAGKKAAGEEAGWTDLDQVQITEAMGAGWNLGNQLEANDGQGNPTEDGWTNVKVTERLIRTVQRKGFRTIRIPISYLNTIGEAPDYAIKKEWLDRIQEIVDWAMKYDLYTIINIHGDGYKSIGGGWLLPDGKNQEAIKEKYAAVWAQVADRFKDYDQHLIYESMNEVGANIAQMKEGEAKDAAITAAYENINSYNQIFVDTVRQSGGNNGRPWAQHRHQLHRRGLRIPDPGGCPPEPGSPRRAEAHHGLRPLLRPMGILRGGRICGHPVG